LDYQTNIPEYSPVNIDSLWFPLMCQAAYQIINPGKRYVILTVSGVDGFDGHVKKLCCRKP
jgi:hypothetical protein